MNKQTSIVNIQTGDQLTAKKLVRPNHGGNLESFCQRYDLKTAEVLDLSTGISPWAWPVPQLPQGIWQRLPHTSDFPELITAASKYYQCSEENLLAVAGSQSAIEVLPQLAEIKSSVAIPGVGYQEHEFCWGRAGYQVCLYDSFEQLEHLIKNGDVAHAVVINPNNPCAEIYPKEHLYALAERLQKSNGFLIVDEAFIDVFPECSLVSRVNDSSLNNLVVLRSIGKFFGVAGLRLGFVIANKNTLQALQLHTSLWSVSSAAHWIGTQMLGDQDWIKQQKIRLKQETESMHQLVTEYLPNLHWKVSASFVSGFGSDQDIRKVEEILGKQGILVRTFYANNAESILRLGIVDNQNKERFVNALTKNKR